METMNLNSREAYKKMTEASKDWSEWAEKAIVLDESRKAMFSKLFLNSPSKTEPSEKLTLPGPFKPQLFHLPERVVPLFVL